MISYPSNMLYGGIPIFVEPVPPPMPLHLLNKVENLIRMQGELTVGSGSDKVV